MPIFEYVCSACNHRFETLVRGEDQPSCPSCDSQHLVKQLSVFAVSKSAGSDHMAAGPEPCGTCGDPRGAGSCSLN
jgi:putative FmdB family regulatory protein